MAVNNKNNTMLKLVLFAFAVCLGIIGCFLVLDAFLPKERHVAIWVPIIEFSTGALLLVLTFYIGRRNRLARK